MLKSLRISLLAIGCVGLIGCANGGMYQASKTLKIQTLWEKNTGKGTFHHHLNLQPVAWHGRLYVSNYLGSVSVHDAKKGAFMGRYLTGHKITAPAIREGRLLYVASIDGAISAMDMQTKKLAWRKHLPGEVLAKPLMAGDLLLVKTENDHLFAFDAKSGAERWHYQTDAPSLILRGSASPVLAGKAVLVGFANGELAKLDLASGELLWKSQLTSPKGITSIERMVDMDVSPIVFNHRVYWANYQGAVGAYDLDTGASVWQSEASAYAGIARDETNLYVSTASQTVKAYDLVTGKLAWEQKGFDKESMLTGPIVDGDYLLVADGQGYLHCLNKSTGAALTSSKVSYESGYLAPPLLEGKRIIMFSDDGKLTALALD